MNFIVFVNGLVLVFLALLSGMDALLFNATRSVFAESFVLLGTVGGLTALAASSDFSGLKRRHTFVLTALVWLTAGLAGAVPLFLWGLAPADAIFEAMSGITTTGSTVMTGLDKTPDGILLWRALLQALGGVGFIVTGIALLPILRVGGMQLFRTESSEKGRKEVRTAGQLAAATLAIYLTLIFLCFIVYRLGGMDPFDAITHALTTLSTGGFSNYDVSFGYFNSAFLEWAAVVFMILGGLPFAWYIRGMLRGRFRSEQVEAMLTTLAVTIAALTLWLVLSGDFTLFRALRLVAFNVVSVVTTTGFATTDYTEWGPVAAVIFLMLTLVGGCTGSTSGGAKAMRWIIAYRALRVQIRAINHPHGVHNLRYEGRTVDGDVLSGVVMFFSIYALSVFALAFALAFEGLDIATALSAAVTSLANVGPGVGSVIGPAGNFATLPESAKLLLSFGMYLGRLEVLTVLVLFTPMFWREF